MTRDRKRELVALFVVIFAVWPLIQFGAVLQYGVDPWKLFGFGMYSVPGPQKGVQIAGQSADGTLTPINPQTFSDRERVAKLEFFEGRRALGKLQSPSEWAQVMLAERPEFEAAVLAIVELKLDRRSARLVMTSEALRVDRQGEIESVDLRELSQRRAEP